MEQEYQAHQNNHQEFLDKLVLQIIDRPVDQGGPVIGFDDFHSFRQALFQFRQLLFHACDGLECIFTEAHHDDSPDHFSFAIEFSDTPAHLRPQSNIGHVRQPDRRTLGIHSQWYRAEVLDRLQISGCPNHIFGFAHLDHRSANLAVALLNGGTNR